MKFFSILLSLCFSLNVLAQSGTIQELEKAFDNYQYSITVEWDQKDTKFQEKETEKLFTTLSHLIQEKGLKREEILALAKKKMNNDKTFAALELKLGLLSDVQTSKELMNMLKDSSKDFYAKGASWNGDVILGNVILGLVAVAVAYAIWFGITHDCVEYRDGDTVCYDETLYSGFDSNGEPYTVYGDTVCEPEQICTEYVKR